MIKEIFYTLACAMLNAILNKVNTVFFISKTLLTE